MAEKYLGPWNPDRYLAEKKVMKDMNIDDMGHDEIWMKALGQFIKKGYSDTEIAKQRKAWVDRIDSHGKAEADKSLLEQSESGIKAIKGRKKQIEEAIK